MKGFTHHVWLLALSNNVPQQIMMFPDSIITAQWCLPVCCNWKSMEQVLELLVCMTTKRGKTHSICELNLRVA